MMKTKLGPNGELFKPTIHETKNFNPEADAMALNKAMKGLGTDENAIVQIIGHRTADERLRIAAEYKTLFGKDLIEHLKSELSGDFEKLVLACMRSPYKHLAYSCYKAIAGAGTDEDTLIQILASSTNEEIEQIKEEYQQVLIEHKHDPNRRNLEADIKNDCGGVFGRVLIALVQANRDEPTPDQMQAAMTQGARVLIDEAKAHRQAEELFKEGEGKLGTDEDTFVRILVKSSVWQVAAIDIAYQKLTSKSLVDAIKSEMSGDLKNVLLTVVESCLDRPGAFAKMLNKAMKGIGTDDDSLIRLISSRADIDLQSIKEAYEMIYAKSLAADVKGETSGDYRKLLMALLNVEQ